jgi:hypothetical protein
VNDDGSIAVEDEVPLNLKVRRAESATVDRTPSRQTVQALGLIVSGVLLLAASRRRGRFVIPAAAALAGGSLAALASAILSNRRRAAREAIIDERIRQSFPASDPAQP